MDRPESGRAKSAGPTRRHDARKNRKTKAPPDGRSRKAGPNGRPSPSNGESQIRPSPFLNPSPPEFWHGIGVFPNALDSLDRANRVAEDAAAALAGLGVGNLSMFCERALIAKPEDSTDRVLASVLLANGDAETVVHLREFLRRRTDVVEQTFAAAFTRREQHGIETQVRDLSRRRTEVLKPLSKLLLLYQKCPDRLHDVQAQSLWLSRPTSFEYQATPAIQTRFITRLKSREDDLRRLVSGALGGRGVKLIGSRKSRDGLTTFAFFREYTGKVRPDFRSNFNVHYGCGLLMFGIDAAGSRLIVKSGNRAVAQAVSNFIGQEAGVEFTLVHDEVFGDYDCEEFRDRVLGGYPSDPGIEIIAADFARSGFGNHGSLTLGRPFLQPSIRSELEHLSHEGLVEIRGPSDVTSLSVLFRGQSVVVTATTVAGGAVRLTFDDSRWEQGARIDFEQAFFGAFGVPLNRLLDPARTALGTLAVYANLLSLAVEDDVQPYQEDGFQVLLEAGIVKRVPIAMRMCDNNLCPSRNVPVDDPTRTTCLHCDHEIQHCTVDRLERDQSKTAIYVAGIFDASGDWRLAEGARELAKNRFFELRRRRPNGREDAVCMLISDRPSAKLKGIFQRTGLPLLLVQSHTDARHVYVDDDGIGHIGLAYLLAAQDSQSTKEECHNLCREVLKRLLQNHEERILKAARLSYERLKDRAVTFTGDSYESDIFNLLRSVFPYTHDLGRRGHIEPDGFVCLPTYESESIDDVGSWNWSYDAKYSAKATGYHLDIEECRKIIQYIGKLRRNRLALFGADRKVRGHVVIANEMDESEISRVAGIVFGKDGVHKSNRDVRLLLMREAFVLRLYEGVRDNVEAIARRRAFVTDETAKLLASAPAERYLILGEPEAAKLIEAVLALPEIESNVDPAALLESLTD